jgi:hypothetical protein
MSDLALFVDCFCLVVAVDGIREGFRLTLALWRGGDD